MSSIILNITSGEHHTLFPEIILLRFMHLFLSDATGVLNNQRFGGISAHRTASLCKYTTLDFTTSQTVWVVAPAVVGQSHVTLNQRMLVVIGCKQNHTTSDIFYIWVQKRSNASIVYPEKFLYCLILGYFG